MAFTHPHINAYVIVGGDSDFLSLVEKLKQYDKKVFVVGGRAFTSIILQRNCHEFIAYENLVRKPSSRGGRPQAVPSSSPIAQAFPIVRRALKILADREVSPQTGLLKSTLLQLDSTFSERNYGASSFLDFVEKLTQAGLVQLKHSGRSVMVELNPSFSDDGEAAATIAPAAATAPASRPEPVAHQQAQGQAASYPQAVPSTGQGQSQGQGPTASSDETESGAGPVTLLGDNAEGVRVAGQLLASATTARWPMYLRNVKQILRAGGFDERRYGFGGLIDLLRACQREGLVRMERDRRGGLRVFQGTAIRPAPAPAQVIQDSVPSEEIETVEAVLESEPDEPDVIEIAPVSVVDTTAELLGRATARRPRTRAAGAPGSRAAGASGTGAPASSGRSARTGTGTRKTGVKKAATTGTRRTSRPKKSTEASDNRGNK
jgi:hypothetical protein